MSLLIALAMAAAPSVEAERLGRRLAELGSLNGVLTMMTKKDTEELIAEHEALTPDQRSALRATAAEVARAALERLTTAMGHEYAAALSEADLRAVVAFQETPAAGAYNAAIPGVMAGAMKSLGPIDFKADTMTAFCAKLPAACPARAK